MIFQIENNKTRVMIF